MSADLNPDNLGSAIAAFECHEIISKHPELQNWVVELKAQRRSWQEIRLQLKRLLKAKLVPNPGQAPKVLSMRQLTD